MKKKQKIGLVLGGGGGKGAYQVGVWKALREYKIEKYITHISATSIGSLNSLLFVNKELDKAIDIFFSRFNIVSIQTLHIFITLMFCF